MKLYRNHLLRDLSSETLERLEPHLERIDLKRGARLFEAGQNATHVYFPESGMVSLVLRASGREIESSVVGREGLAGMPILLGQELTITEAIVQMEGEGIRMPAALLEREFKRGGHLQARLLTYIAAVLAESTQLALCSHVHTPQERLSLWLLMTADRAGNARSGPDLEASLKFDLPPEFLAQMVGTDVSSAAAQVGIMQRAGLLFYSGNRFEICSREDMEDAACDCYGYIQAAFARTVR